MNKSIFSIFSIFSILLIYSCGTNQLEGVEDISNLPKKLVNPNNLHPISGSFFHIGILTVYGNGTITPTFNTANTPVTCSQSKYEFFTNGFQNAIFYGQFPACNQVLMEANNIPYIYNKTNLKISHGSDTYDLYEEISNYIIESKMTPVDLDGDGKLDRIYQVFKK